MEFFLVRIFLSSDWIQRFTGVFSPNTGKYGPGKIPYLDIFHAVMLTKAILRWVLTTPVGLNSECGYFHQWVCGKFMWSRWMQCQQFIMSIYLFVSCHHTLCTARFVPIWLFCIMVLFYFWYNFFNDWFNQINYWLYFNMFVFPKF